MVIIATLGLAGFGGKSRPAVKMLSPVQVDYVDEPLGMMQIPSGASPTTTRGFTGHEMVDGTGIIHMNGRIYDAGLGRFLQPDPLVQSPDNAQSWNAYTYVFNNPLAYTDPTGMFTFRQLVGIAIAVIGTLVAPQFGSVWAKIGYAMAIGFASGYVVTGTFRGGVIGAFSAAISFGVAGLDLTGRVSFQGMTGGRASAPRRQRLTHDAARLHRPRDGGRHRHHPHERSHLRRGTGPGKAGVRAVGRYMLEYYTKDGPFCSQVGRIVALTEHPACCDDGGPIGGSTHGLVGTNT